jgi:hypothetical protein
MAFGVMLATTGAVSAVTSAEARDLATEFRTGFNPGSQRSLQADLDRRHFEGQVKPDSFATGIDLGGK